MQQTREVTGIPKGMRPGQRQLNEASLVVALSEAVPTKMRAAVREITHVMTAPEARGKRLATALLNCVCQEADANGMTLLLTARAAVGGDDATPLPGPNDLQLIAWYEKFGFVQLQETPTGVLMARKVRERPRVQRPDNVVSMVVQRALRAGH